MTQDDAVEIIAKEVAASIHSIGWSHAAGFGSPRHFDNAPDQDIAVRLTQKPISSEQMDTLRHWIRRAWHLSLDDVVKSSKQEESSINVDHMIHEYKHDHWNLMVKIEKTSCEKKLAEAENNPRRVPIDRGISAVVTQLEMYQEWWYHDQVSLRDQRCKNECA
jgi:hypothetical protein